MASSSGANAGPPDSDATIIRHFTHAGFECCIGILDDRHYCGYVKTSFPRAAYGELWNAVDVHAGLSYGPDKEGWVGFACNKVGDVCLRDNGQPLKKSHTVLSMETNAEQHWRPDDVAEEVRRLAEQLRRIQ